jgi:hypothetical protein
MANRFNAKSRINYEQQPLPSGYPTGATSDFVVPPVGLEDVDMAFFNLFDKELPLSVGGSNGGELKKVPIVFAGGEKWAMLKKNRPLRDKTNSLILPIITIGRPNFSQDPSVDITGRGINQQTGEIVIKKRLDSSDRDYQKIINRIFLQHQDDLATIPRLANPGQLTTLNDVGALADDPTVKSGGLMLADRRKNIIETLVIPSPQFVTVNYEVIIWTQYTHHMNQINETLMSSFLPQTRGWRLDTPKGYWFIARITESAFTAETNFDDMSQGERIIKQKFNVEVPAYILASNSPGAPVPVKKYISSPNISFSVGTPSDKQDAITQQEFTFSDPFLGSDDPTLPLDIRNNNRRDKRATGSSRFFVSDEVDRNDPALLSQPRGTPVNQYTRILTKGVDGRLKSQYVRVASKNSSVGETVFSPGTDMGGLQIVVVEE